MATCAAWFGALIPSLATAQDGRFIDFPDDTSTTSYDVSTVQMISPGRFTVISTIIDNPDVMKFKLKVHDTLETYCTRPDGKYDAPAELFILGQPDMAVEKINVESRITEIARKKYSVRNAIWRLPYKRLAFRSSNGSLSQGFELFTCVGLTAQRTDKDQREGRSVILNGIQAKKLFDCKRGLMGSFLNENDDPATAITYFVQPDTYGFLEYLAVCQRVTNEPPYLPK